MADIECSFIRTLTVNHRVAGQATHAERNLQLVPKYILLFPTERRHLEGIHLSTCIAKHSVDSECYSLNLRDGISSERSILMSSTVLNDIQLV